MKKDLVFKKESMLSLSDSLKKGLADIKKEKRRIEAQSSLTLLLDCSGSMSEYVKGKSKFDALMEAIQDYPRASYISFSESACLGIETFPAGETNMAEAFRLCTTLPRSKRQTIIVISDGLPNSESQAIEEALKLATPVNIIYIGPGGDKGEEFMKKLAEITGGRQTTVNTKDTSLLLEKEIKKEIKLLE